MTDEEDGAVRFPIDGILDLHTFRPSEVKELLPDYISECRKKGIRTVRVIHGKGTGAMREIVHSSLGKIEGVTGFRTAGEEEGGWGATIVELAPEGQNG